MAIALTAVLKVVNCAGGQVSSSWVRDPLQPLHGQIEGLDPVLNEFRRVIHSDEELKLLSESMFVDIPKLSEYDSDPSQQHAQVRSFDDMLSLFNGFLKQGPRWFVVEDNPIANAAIGCPFNAALTWPMATTPGYEFFLRRDVNEQFQSILNKWGEYLESEQSVETLNSENGWFSTEAVSQLTAKANNAARGTDPAALNYSFEDLYECPDPKSPTRGFKSWDDFFTRQFKPDRRPVESLSNDSVIVNSCESMPWRLQTNVKYSDNFEIKEQYYSLEAMLNREKEAEAFDGGTVYQAFLSPLTYHRWHAPVSGKVVKIRKVPGTYYSESKSQGFSGPDGADPEASVRSQAFIAHTATRGIIFIEADNPKIGLMAVTYIGMAEVSSCMFTVKEGDHVQKGQELGEVFFLSPEGRLLHHCFVFFQAICYKVRPN